MNSREESNMNFSRTCLQSNICTENLLKNIEMKVLLCCERIVNKCEEWSLIWWFLENQDASTRPYFDTFSSDTARHKNFTGERLSIVWVRHSIQNE